MSLRTDIKSLASNLTPDEQAELLRDLLARVGGRHSGYPLGPELASAERWLWRGIGAGRSPRIRNARIRMWFVFMFLRYAGMRLEEIFNLRMENLNMSEGLIRVPMSGGCREIPLSQTVTRRIRHGLDTWPESMGLSAPFRCDSSLVRRFLGQCATACSLKAATLNARNLRRNRALELELAGVSGDLVNLFMGRMIKDENFNYSRGAELLREAVRNEHHIRTSARNSFYGQIVHIEKSGILVEAVLETAGGLRVGAVITETSRANLGLEPGVMVTALVKAPWVKAFPAGELDREMNVFTGVVEEVRSDKNASEILVSLPQGYLVCALYVGAPVPDLKKGLPADVCFSPLSVILTTG